MPLLTEMDLTGAPDEQLLENELRPRSLDEFIGQNHLKDSLRVFLQAAHLRSEPLDHVLLYGNPGLGKTTLAHIIAAEMGHTCRITSGPALEKVGDLAGILTSLQTGDILFIDEIHRLNRTIEEVMYPALEDFALDLTIGKGPGAQTLRMQLNHFTLIGATTRPSLISSPLRDRFGATFQLDFYSNEDVQKIIERSARILELKIQPDAVTELSPATRRTPRIANRLLRRVRDVVQVERAPCADASLVKKTLDMLRVDACGLDHVDRKILHTIIETFRGGPVGLSTLAAAVAQEMETLETVHEPFLLQIGMLERTPKGRVATDRAFAHLGLPFVGSTRLV